ncbi:MAG: hypothetical protein R2851_25435 [Caldilineaceae bacterium]
MSGLLPVARLRGVHAPGRYPAYAAETLHPVTDFDIIGFSLPYEQLYTTVLTMLDLTGIPCAADRSGGPSAGHCGRVRLLQPGAHESVL